ncbi:MAG TPA: MAPEG family protein [Usitatibacter sp.]|jgi:hypothetical protein|nr:MAPEG family protein [Usitatibacter sp.]
MTPHIVPIYAALLGLIFVTLSGRTVRLRRQLRISLGHAGDERMLRATRAHSNFAEYVPMALLLFFFVEAGGGAPWLVHSLCATLVVGRLAHALGVSRVPEWRMGRALGLVLTIVPIVVAAMLLLWSSLQAGP